MVSLSVEGQCHADLADLARGCRFDGSSAFGVGGGQHQKLIVLHVLLVECRGALFDLSAGGVGQERSECALPVHALVVGETFVLDGDDRELHLVGDLIAGDFEAALLVQPCDRVSGCVDHGRNAGNNSLGQLGGDVVDGAHRLIRCVSEAPDDRKEHTREQGAGQCRASGEFGHCFLSHCSCQFRSVLCCDAE